MGKNGLSLDSLLGALIWMNGICAGICYLTVDVTRKQPQPNETTRLCAFVHPGAGVGVAMLGCMLFATVYQAGAEFMAPDETRREWIAVANDALRLHVQAITAVAPVAQLQALWKAERKDRFLVAYVVLLWIWGVAPLAQWYQRCVLCSWCT